MARKKIGEILIAAGVLDEARLRAALIEQQRWGGPLGRMLVDLKLIDEPTLVDALSRQLSVPAVDLDAIEVPRAVLDLVPADLAEHHGIVPIAQPMKFLDIAMADPSNLGIVDELQIRTKLNVRPHLAGPKAIERAIARYYGRGVTAFRRATASAQPHKALEIETPRDLERDAEITALQQRVSRLEALVARDEDVLRKVLALLVDKGVASRDEIVERLK
jgi:type IV pilus assembly protein PilB